MYIQLIIACNTEHIFKQHILFWLKFLRFTSVSNDIFLYFINELTRYQFAEEMNFRYRIISNTFTLKMLAQIASLLFLYHERGEIAYAIYHPVIKMQHLRKHIIIKCLNVPRVAADYNVLKKPKICVHTKYIICSNFYLKTF